VLGDDAMKLVGSRFVEVPGQVHRSSFGFIRPVPTRAAARLRARAKACYVDRHRDQRGHPVHAYRRVAPVPGSERSAGEGRRGGAAARGNLPPE
jgi:hypothetical protein